MTKQVVLLSVALAAVPALLMAQETAIGQLGGKDLANQVQTFQKRSAEQGQRMSIPDPSKYAKDVFAECGPEFMQTGRGLSMGVTLPQAVGMVQTCLDRTYNRPAGYQTFAVKASAGRFGLRNCPQGSIQCGAITEVEGVIITVTGRLLPGNSVLLDLYQSLRKRGEKLLGWNATVSNQAEIIHRKIN